MSIICNLNLDELVIWFTGESHQVTTPVVVKVMMYLLISNPLRVVSANEVVTLFNGPLNNNKSTPIKQTGQK